MDTNLVEGTTTCYQGVIEIFHQSDVLLRVRILFLLKNSFFSIVFFALPPFNAVTFRPSVRFVIKGKQTTTATTAKIVFHFVMVFQINFHHKKS